MLSSIYNEKCKCLIIVSYQLPVSLKKVNNKYEITLKNCRSSIANFRQIDPNMNKIWIGTLEEDIPIEDRDEVDSLLYKYNCIPVFIEKKLKYKFYYNFCKGLLWPVLHYSIPLTNDVNYSENWEKYWGSYYIVNNLFVKKICLFLEDKDTLVWIHNYHFFLLPSLLRKKKPSARIGLFIHTVFPSSDVFRCLPETNTLIHSILSCDLIGFHTYDYARHFLSCCRRLLYLDFKVLKNGRLGFNYHGRDVGIKISHLGINSNKILKFSKDNRIKEIVDDLQTKYKNKKIILSIDGTDIVKGGVLKLQAFNHFLSTYPVFKDNIILFQFLLEEKNINFERRKHIYEEIENIKSKYGNNIIKVVNFKDNDVTGLLFLVSICKISCLGLFTSYWDGLNTFPYEYTLLDNETPGSLIISRFMGCYRCLPGVLSVNPLCLKNISKILNKGLTMSMERRKISHRLRSKYVIKHNFEYWANDFIKELFDISKNNSKKKYMEIGWGSNTKLIALDLSIEHLENSNYLSEFDISEKRLILLDYGGTLVQRQNNILLDIDNEVLHNLSTLVMDKRNIVIIISGQRRDILDNVLKKIPNIGLIAEKGAFIKFPNSSRWVKSYKSNDIEWVKIADKIIQDYTDVTPGSYKEVKDTYILWNYEKSDPEYGKMQASDLSKYLGQIFENKNVVINQYETCRLLEIRLKNISKKNASKIALRYFQSQLFFENINENKAYILSIGNDISDDTMFSMISSKLPNIKSKYTTTIGLRPTTAKYYLSNVCEVKRIIKNLTLSNNLPNCIKHLFFYKF